MQTLHRLLAFCCLRVSFSFQFALLCSPFTTASHPRGVSILIATTVAHKHTHTAGECVRVPATTTTAISTLRWPEGTSPYPSKYIPPSPLLASPPVKSPEPGQKENHMR
nr:uncharacterized protein LOC123003217 [Drosophila takahashii]